MRKAQLLLFIIALALTCPCMAAQSNRIHTEIGLLQNTYNQVRIPGDEGTQFNMRQSFSETSPYFRLDYKKFFENGHGIRLLYAPLKLEGEYTYKKDILFNGSVFNKNEETKTLFKFNSYRVSYFNQWVKKENWKLNIGVTAKVRDADITLRQGNTKKGRSDLGFVPLFYLWSEYWVSENSKFTLDFDGLAAPQGRAFDVALMYGHRLSPSLIANLGYRMLEGGADNDKVYTFSMFNFYFAALEIEF